MPPHPDPQRHLPNNPSSREVPLAWITGRTRNGERTPRRKEAGLDGGDPARPPDLLHPGPGDGFGFVGAFCFSVENYWCITPKNTSAWKCNLVP